MHSALVFRVRGAVTLVAAVIFGLTGCIFANNIGPADVSVQDGSLVLAFCYSGEVESITVEQRPPEGESASSWSTVWSGQGIFAVETGDLVILDDSVDGLVGGPIAPLDVREGTTYGVFINLHTGMQNREVVSGFQSSFVVPFGGLAEGVWLNFSGGAKDTPCK